MTGQPASEPSYLASRFSLVVQLIRQLPALRRAGRPAVSWDQLIDTISRFEDGFFRPAQVRAEIRAALEEIERLQPQRVLEIGTSRGGTFYLLCRASAPSATLISLDLPGGRWGGGYSNWKTFVFRRLAPPDQSVHFVRGNSHEPASKHQVQKVLGGQLLDVLFIDGDHSYEGVKPDFLLYRDLVRPGGLIFFHDIALHPPEQDCHVDRFWAEVRQQYPSRELIERPDQGWAGIGMLVNEAAP